MPVTTTTAFRQLSDGNPIGTTLGQSPADLISFYSVTPVAQPAAPSAHNTAGGAAGATTALFRDTTFTGGVGSSTYSVGDVVASLKALGLLAA